MSAGLNSTTSKGSFISESEESDCSVSQSEGRIILGSKRLRRLCAINPPSTLCGGGGLPLGSPSKFH